MSSTFDDDTLPSIRRERDPAVMKMDSAYSGYEHIRFDRKDGILRVTLDRPDVLNAINQRLHRELAQAFFEIALDPHTRVVILTGAGRAFCAGGDLAWMEQMLAAPSPYGVMNAEAKRIVYGLLELEKPVICRLNGDAMGLGATIALLCDVVIASDTARIADPHVRVGLVAGDGGALIWPQLIGYARARELLMGGGIVEAKRAAEIGLISRVCAAENLDAEVDRLAGQWANGAIEAISWTKITVNIGLKQAMHAIMDAGMAYEALSMREPFHAAAVAKMRSRSV